ncbi:MAG: helix-turn-helix domain-containing protein [Gordonia sp. (in: high G+C Gram-positive bacteria)]|uniref:GlxA family transcriptional regulator n=1 Tax=Gordonia sp. (in: high G+C Gram-positive bacteria) TaxID=84139 RepID=UPI0039E31A26
MSLSTGTVEVDVLLLDGASASAVGATIDILSAANRIATERRFDFRYVGVGESTRLRGDLAAPTVPLASNPARELIVVPGLGAATASEVTDRCRQPDMAVTLPWLAAAAAAGADIAASCSAVFVLGDAGLLTGRRCVTTWWLGADLAQLAPGCRVDIDEMVVRDGPIWTAGSAFAHVDLTLALVRHFGGVALADEVGRRLIVDERTSQAGFLAPSHLAARDEMVAELETYVRTHLTRAHTLRSLAVACRTSARTLDRRSRAGVGMSPMQLVARIRLERALYLLRTTSDPLDSIAAAVGLGDANALHRLVKRHTGCPPGALRGRASA